MKKIREKSGPYFSETAITLKKNKSFLLSHRKKKKNK